MTIKFFIFFAPSSMVTTVLEKCFLQLLVDEFEQESWYEEQ